MEAIRIQLQSLLEKQGLSYYRLAQLSGIDRANISRYLTGVRPLTLDTARTLAQAMGHDIEVRLVKV